MDAGNTYEDIFINNRLVTIQNQLNYLYAKVREVFRYTNLPLTLPTHVLEKYLITNGYAVVYALDGDLFVSDATPSGGTDLYGDDHDVTIDHRINGAGETLHRTIGVDAVLVLNDSEKMGLTPLLTEFAIMTSQAKITLLRNLVDLRGNYIIQAKDEASYKSALEYENAIRAGDTAIIMAEEFDGMSEGIVVHSTPISNSPATQTIELFQYINSHYYSELGISLNNNMKREYVSDSEMEKSSGMPLINNMLSCRRNAIRDINALFGADLDVCLSEEWDDELESDQEEDQVPDGSDDPDEQQPAPAPEPNPEPEPEPEIEDVPASEVIQATDAVTGENHDDAVAIAQENEHDEDEADPAPGDAASEDTSDEDDIERNDVEPEAEDDEE